MNSFDATSGAIDAALAFAFYALVVFGIRKIVHRVRGTEPKEANNKWMWLSALGLAAAVFVGGGSMASNTSDASTTVTTTRCDQALEALKALNTKLEAPTLSSTTKNYLLLQVSYVVVNDSQCFDAQMVASAQAYITRSAR